MKIDRLSVRSRPPGQPVMYQRWDRLLFMHWRLPPEVLRPLVPDELHIDTYDGSAWLSITPFTMPEFRLRGVPALPFVSSSHELNVRTYVHYGGVPGVWFLSLDASNPLAVLGARVAFGLPYFAARMTLQEHEGTIRFTSRRWCSKAAAKAPPVNFEVAWRGAEIMPAAQPGTLDFFLIERYCLYALRRGRLFRARIFHEPWPLRRAELVDFSSTVAKSHGLLLSRSLPVLHGQAASLKVGVWAPSRVTSI